MAQERWTGMTELIILSYDFAYGMFFSLIYE